MKKNNIIMTLFILSISLLLTSFKVQPEAIWRKESEKNGIIVYLRDIQGSPIKEFKAQTRIKAPVNKIVTFLKDFRSYPSWVYANEGTYLIQNKGDKEFIYYTRIKLPKPVNDRDVVIHMKIIELSENKCLIKTIGLPKFISEKPNIVRVQHFQGMWEITRINNEETLVVMQSHSDPAGTIPPWLINTLITNGPYETLEKMNKILTGKK